MDNHGYFHRHHRDKHLSGFGGFAQPFGRFFRCCFGVKGIQFYRKIMSICARGETGISGPV